MLILSSSKGWGILCFQQIFFLIKKNELYSFLPHNKAFLTFLTIFFVGFQKGYFQYLKLKGMGYKFIRVGANLILKFGYSHRIVYVNYGDVYCKFFTKFILRLETRSLWLLSNITYFFRNIRKRNMYKKKGIFFKGALITLKSSSKKSKF
jgi:ribosomal protein L6P/L9E